MADFSNPGGSVSDMAAGNPGINMGTTGSMRDLEYASDDLWGEHDAHFRAQYPSRPYAAADRTYEHYQPAYRYGYEAGRQHAGRGWHEVEADLERGWRPTAGTTGTAGTGSVSGTTGATASAWADMKHAVRDAFEHVGHRR
jgi:hypothetical protein